MPDKPDTNDTKSTMQMLYMHEYIWVLSVIPAWSFTDHSHLLPLRRCHDILISDPVTENFRSPPYLETSPSVTIIHLENKVSRQNSILGTCSRKLPETRFRPVCRTKCRIQVEKRGESFESDETPSRLESGESGSASCPLVCCNLILINVSNSSWTGGAWKRSSQLRSQLRHWRQWFCTFRSWLWRALAVAVPFARFLSTRCRTRQTTGRWKQSQEISQRVQLSYWRVKLAFVPLQATALAIFRKSGFVVVEDSMLVGLFWTATQSCGHIVGIFLLYGCRGRSCRARWEDIQWLGKRRMCWMMCSAEKFWKCATQWRRTLLRSLLCQENCNGPRFGFWSFDTFTGPAVMILLRYAECFARRWWDHTVPAIGGMVGTHLDGHLALGRPCLNRTFASSDSGSKVAKYAKCCKIINKSPLGLNKTDPIESDFWQFKLESKLTGFCMRGPSPATCWVMLAWCREPSRRLFTLVLCLCVQIDCFSPEIASALCSIFCCDEGKPST